MHVPAIAFLIAALFCSMLGRVLLISAAFGVSTMWGFIVLLVPFGPLIFRYNYRELAYPTRHWRVAVGPLMLLFFINGGSLDTFRSFMHPGTSHDEVASAGDTDFHLPNPSKVVTAALGKGAGDSADAAPGAPAAPVKGAAAAPAPIAEAPAPGKPASVATSSAVATPTPAVAASMAAMAPAPKVLTVAERVDANHREFERLATWYDNLKHERGYLRKGDTEGVQAYNAQAAQYQAALQLAKTEEAALAKLNAIAKK